MRKFILSSIILALITCHTGFTWPLPRIEVPQASVVYDVNGEAIKGLGEQNRINIELSEMPNYFIKAVIAVEDKNFYQHHGIDMAGILRAIYVNIRERKIVEGGSTITQQTAKNLFLSNERTFLRKFKELFYALELERQYSKDEILTMYCNTIYFGQGAYGIEVAARTFFGKSARDLSLAESALLAGIPRWPSNYDPYINPEAAKKRQLVVLQRMQEEGYIDEESKARTAEEKLQYKKTSYIKGEAPYFIALVKDYLSKKYGEQMIYQGGLKVYTSLDLYMQRAANQALQSGLENYDPNLQAALVAVDPGSGGIRALIGGRDYASSTFNRVFSKRQPGSTFKPFMYSLALYSGFTAADKIMCEEVEYELPNGDIYRPGDYGKEPYHWREFTLKEAVMKSDNVVAVRVNSILGPTAAASYAEKFGFSNIQPVLSLPLGASEVRPIDMALAYAVFANRGIYSNANYILKVTDRNGKVLEENYPQQRRVIGEDNAYIITNILEGVLEAGGTGAHLRNIIGDRIAAGKTGTTDEFKDAWFVGFTPRISCAVWVGYDKNRDVNISGGVIAGPIWAHFIEGASRRLAEGDFYRPDNIRLLNICLDSGLVASESCPRQVEMAFVAGSEPEDICYEHREEDDWSMDDGTFPWWQSWSP
ncbi:transglycosylase domain-containing protein [Syntrophomonas wolfei]|uniref:transglycosylase domain-containing protein n=1 Tax=Syntrophomonas wolfei TaxID=863 RepID=UPI000774B58B|nr:PBP1A family penicillin-binding protein [Syntrophomonas wolfei]